MLRDYLDVRIYRWGRDRPHGRRLWGITYPTSGDLDKFCAPHFEALEREILTRRCAALRNTEMWPR